jgi:hypothetical protein
MAAPWQARSTSPARSECDGTRASGGRLFLGIVNGSDVYGQPCIVGHILIEGMHGLPSDRACAARMALDGFRHDPPGAMMQVTIDGEVPMQTTLHQPRIAWDAALALIGAARADDATFGWCRDWVAAILGSAEGRALEATRRRLIDPIPGPNETQLQLGLWRVRLEDAQRGDPAVGAALRDLAAAVAPRLPH